MNLGLRLLRLGDLFVGLLDIGVGVGGFRDLAEIGLGQELVAKIGELAREFGAGGRFFRLGLLRHHLGDDQIVEQRLVARGSFQLARQACAQIVASDRQILVGDLDAVHLGENFRGGGSGAGG